MEIHLRMERAGRPAAPRITRAEVEGEEVMVGRQSIESARWDAEAKVITDLRVDLAPLPPIEAAKCLLWDIHAFLQDARRRDGFGSYDAAWEKAGELCDRIVELQGLATSAEAAGVVEQFFQSKWLPVGERQIFNGIPVEAPWSLTVEFMNSETLGRWLWRAIARNGTHRQSSQQPGD